MILNYWFFVLLNINMLDINDACINVIISNVYQLNWQCDEIKSHMCNYTQQLSYYVTIN